MVNLHVIKPVVPPPCWGGVWEQLFFFTVFNASIQIAKNPNLKRHRDYRDTIIEYYRHF